MRVLQQFKRSLFSLVAGLVMACALLFGCGVSAQTVPANFTAGIDTNVVPFVLSGQRTVTVTSVIRWRPPFGYEMTGVQVAARASGGSTPTLTVDVLSGGVSRLSAPVAVTAGATAWATLLNSALPATADVTINLAIGGGTPTWDDITVILWMRRLL